MATRFMLLDLVSVELRPCLPEAAPSGKSAGRGRTPPPFLTGVESADEAATGDDGECGEVLMFLFDYIGFGLGLSP